MRRKTQRSLLQLACFGCLLLLIITLNRSQDTKTLAWSTIRYKTSSAMLPRHHGVCPGLAESSKPALVVARVAADGDTKWLDPLTDLYHHCVYTADAPLDPKSPYLQVPANRGHEAMAYLTFLIDNYAHIPAAGAVFVHGSRWAWHNDSPDYDNAALLAALNISSALAPWGYHNLRCDWSASTCSPASTPPQGSLETSIDAALKPWSARLASDKALPHALAVLFGVTEDDSAYPSGQVYLGRADAIRSQCCAQFVVSRESVWQHSREEYIALRQWLLDGSNDGNTNADIHIRRNAAPSDDRVAGRILSYTWHILFTQQREPNASHNMARSEHDGIDLQRLNAQACPRADECYCRLYGRCNLEGCTRPDGCFGQYTVPPNFKLPEDWAATHT